MYPYEYLDSSERFEETELPPKDTFYSKLNMKGISDKDYEHAQSVWDSMKEKNLEAVSYTHLTLPTILLV